MTDRTEKERRRGPTMLSELVGRALDPLVTRRGLATADLIAAWPEIIGARYAGSTCPEKIVWARGDAQAGNGGVLHLRVDGPSAIFLQHELDQVVERVNAFLGYAAIARVRLVQAPLARRQREETVGERPLDDAAEARLDTALAAVDDDGLRAALDRLGRGVLARR